MSKITVKPKKSKAFEKYPLGLHDSLICWLNDAKIYARVQLNWLENDFLTRVALQQWLIDFN